jgi:hypothetical protein
MGLSPSPSNVLTITVGGITHSINLASYLDNTQIQGFSLNDLSGLVTITETNGNSWTINLSNVVKNLETSTSILNVIVGHKIADYSNEDGLLFPINETVSTITVVGNDATFTNEAGTPVTFKAYSNTVTIQDAFNTDSITIVVP